MKKIAIFIAACLCLPSVNAQKIVEKHMNFYGKESLEIDIQIADSIDITTWNKSEVFATASVNVNDNKDNDAYRVLFEESGSIPRINAAFDNNFFRRKENNCTKAEIMWKIYLPEKAKFNVETINGDVTITGSTDEMKVKTVSGFIDLAVPIEKKADIRFSTVTGTVYTNHNLALADKPHDYSSRIVQRMNGGGSSIDLETVSGDIFFRKSD